MSSSKLSCEVDAAARPLLRLFHAQRPPRVGSLLVTILGDSIAPRGGEIALASLIRLAKPFQLSERLVRTSIGRLAHDDWVQSARIGRLSYYRLTERGRSEFVSATRRIYGDVADKEWSGRWTLLLMPTLGSREREIICRSFRWRGFGQPMPGVLAHAGDHIDGAREELARHAFGEHVLALRSESINRDADAHFARCTWDLSDIERRYRRFIRTFRPIAHAVQRDPIGPATAFAIRTLLVHEFRRILLRDPQLPSILLPPAWPGAEAFTLCRAIYQQVFDRAERFLTVHGANRHGPLPEVAPEALRRFSEVSP